MSQCKRCGTNVPEGIRWCEHCAYPGIDNDYEEYQALLDEGYRRIDAAVLSGWQDPVEAGAYVE